MKEDKKLDSDNKSEATRTSDPSSCGLSGFDFTDLDIYDHRGHPCCINFMKLIFALWPGDIKQQLMSLNARIIRDNENKKRNKVQLISLREFATFIGIMLVACLEGKKGSKLWQGAATEGEGYNSQVDLSAYMSAHRHTQIRRYFLFIFANESKESVDQWWQVVDGVAAFNENRRRHVRAGVIKVMDELMSAFQPQTTATGE